MSSGTAASFNPEPPALSEHTHRLARRVVSIALLHLFCGLALLLLPIALPVFALLDLVLPPRSWARVRALLSIVWILICEVVGVAVLIGLWLAFLLHRGRERFVRHNAAVQRRWTDALFAGCQRIYGITVVVEGREAARGGPALFFVRHVSLVDTVLTATLFANRDGMRLRYVLKDELLLDPCIDIVGNRLPNVFVTRGADSAGDIAAVQRLAANLEADEGVLIYPEGTRFSPAKLERAKARLQGDPAIGDRVRAFGNLLPPRSGGPLALLRAAPHADLVLVAHHGLEGAGSLRNFWRGKLVGKVVLVNVRRIPASEIPDDARLDSAWLVDRWLEMDRWLGESAQ